MPMPATGSSWTVCDGSRTASVPLLELLRDPEQADLLDRCRQLVLPAGAVFLRPEDDLAAVIVSGTAVASIPDGERTSVVSHLLGPGGVAGLPVVFGGADLGTEVTAITTVHALLLRGDDLRRRLIEQPAFGVGCLQVVSDELAALRRDLANLAHRSATQRIVHRLLELADRSGETVEGEVHISLPLTQEMLGSWARVSRETTAKTLHGLRDAGLLRTGRRDLTIRDLAGLRAWTSTPAGDPQASLQELLRLLST
jgi:CRP/FNR family transcriptional regulator, cyclic AMP receptor protein